MAAPKKGLGSKGLGMEALINNQMNDLNHSSAVAKGGVLEVDINKIEPNKKQPRRHFEEDSLEELAVSIREYGIIQPILLKKVEDYYEIIAGERRWRASKIAGLTKIPSIIKECDDSASFELALVENLQREDLNPIEEAASYRYLCDEFHFSQEEVAAKVGKSRSAVTNALRLLNLDNRVLNFVAENKISSGHARTLLSLENGEQQFELAERIIEDDLSVREVEFLVKKEKEKKHDGKEEKKEVKETTIFRTETYSVLENDLRTILGTKVKLSAKKNKGKIEIEYYSDEDLDRLIGLIKSRE